MSDLPAPWNQGSVVAHRGSRILWPENTMLAFANALDLGADHLETDLRLTADGHVICFHDPTVDRTTEGTGPVSSFPLDDLRGLDAGFRHRMDGEFPFRGRGIRPGMCRCWGRAFSSGATAFSPAPSDAPICLEETMPR